MDAFVVAGTYGRQKRLGNTRFGEPTRNRTLKPKKTSDIYKRFCLQETHYDSI